LLGLGFDRNDPKAILRDAQRKPVLYIEGSADFEDDDFGV
jgi:hypothetical protein